MNTDDLQERLRRLTELRDSGVLSESEYEAARKAALTEALPVAAPAPKDKEAAVSAEDVNGGGRIRRGTLLTGVTIAAIIILVAVVAVVLARSGNDSGSPSADAASSAAPSTPKRKPLRFSSSCTNDRVCPAIGMLTARDAGGTIEVSVSYCDRTKGAVQTRTYDFRLYDARGRATPWVDSITRNQSQACNTITSTLQNNYEPGTYQARVKIFNADTGQQSTAKSDGFVID